MLKRKQHLSHFLQTTLIKKVNQEADQEWALKATLPTPKFEIKREKIKLSVGLWNLVRQLKI